MRISPTISILLVIVILLTTSCSSNIKLNSIPTLTSTSMPMPSPYLIELTPVIGTIKGDLRNQIRNLEHDMPRANSESYIVPLNKERMAFAELVTALDIGDLVRAAQIAPQNHYELLYYIDCNDNQAVSYLLRENEPIQKGWGLYAIRVDSTSNSNIIIEAPHPLYDINTPSIALNIYRALDAHALLIAGAHRNANSDGTADVAHAPKSIFQSVHKALLEDIQTISEDVIIIQIHGFQSSDHPGYPQVVIGFGAKLPSTEDTLTIKLRDALTKQGITVGLCTGDVWQDLCGTKNVQATTSDGVVFVHIELDEKIRKSDKDLITALVYVFGD